MNRSATNRCQRWSVEFFIGLGEVAGMGCHLLLPTIVGDPITQSTQIRNADGSSLVGRVGLMAGMAGGEFGDSEGRDMAPFPWLANCIKA